MKQGSIAKAFSPEAKLKRNIRRHFTKLGFAKADDGTLILPGEGKEVVRRLHGGQRAEKLAAGSAFLDRALCKLLPHFADGSEIDPSRIRLRLVRVLSDTSEAELFRRARVRVMVAKLPLSACVNGQNGS